MHFFFTLLPNQYLLENITFPLQIKRHDLYFSRGCGALWWSRDAPAGIFRLGKVDVAVTSVPETTRIGTLTPGLIRFHQKDRELPEYHVMSTQVSWKRLIGDFYISLYLTWLVQVEFDRGKRGETDCKAWLAS